MSLAVQRSACIVLYLSVFTNIQLFSLAGIASNSSSRIVKAAKTPHLLHHYK
jgi:hypothetical protein